MKAKKKAVAAGKATVIGCCAADKELHTVQSLSIKEMQKSRGAQAGSKSLSPACFVYCMAKAKSSK